MKNGADVVAGPDAYRSLPLLLARAGSGQDAVNVMLSADEVQRVEIDTEYSHTGRRMQILDQCARTERECQRL